MTHSLDASIQHDAMPDTSVTSKNSETQDGENTITFESLSLNKPILKALTKSGYTSPTPIQAGAIPHALNGRDLLLSAQTGSGKTAAFVLPILDKLSRIPRLEQHIYALILTPTRELAQQVHDSVRRYGGNVRGLYSIPLVGGAPYSGQIRALRKGVQIVIATPGRLIDHMNEGRVDLSKLDVLVLDEADRMLDMGFADDIKTILENAPESRQTVMSSATWDGAVGKIAESFTNNPEKVSIKVESAHIEESVYFCDDFHHKNKILLELLNDEEINQAVIFAATKRSTEQLAETLTEAGLKARYLHGDLPQGKRNRIISDVKNGKCDFLIATDVAARGIDISAISHVVNYDLPRQVEDYVHRIGRCGRAGRTGVAMNLCSFDDRGQLRNINRYLKRNMSEAVVEGLEPKRAPFEQEERRSKGRDGRGRRDGRDGRRGFGRRDDRSFGERAERRFEDKPRFDDRPQFARERRVHREFDRQEPRFERRERPYEDNAQRAPRFEREGYRGERQFDRTERRFDNERGYYRQHNSRPDNYRQENHRHDGYRNEYRQDDYRERPRQRRDDADFYQRERQDRPERRHEYQERSENRRYADSSRFERRFEDKKPRFSERSEYAGDKRSDKSFDKRNAPRGFKKPKAVEEVFFAKRQAKKEKRRFGDVN